MSKTVTVQARMEPELKTRAKEVLATLGLTESAAISLFYAQIINQNGIPFELKVPNAETRAALAEDLSDAPRFDTVEELFEDCLNGELRAIGDVLYDQWAMMNRCGINAFELDANVTLDTFQNALGELSGAYQPAADTTRGALWARGRG